MHTLTAEGIQTILGRLGVEGPIPPFESADIQNCPIDIYLSHLADILVQLTDSPPQVAYESIQWPNEYWDLVVVLPRLRLQDRNIKTLAGELKEKFPTSHLFANPVADGIHLRFFLSLNSLCHVLLPYIIDRGPSYGFDRSIGLRNPALPNGERKKIVVEFSSPNIGREFDGNHLRSTIIGAYIASLYESSGWDVVRMNFLGDWGQPLGLLATGWSRFGSEEALNADPLRHLLDIYTRTEELAAADETHSITVERDANFWALEERDPDAVAQGQRFRDISEEKYTDLYARLNIKFDDYSGESEVNHDTINEVLTSLGDRITLDEEKDGWIIDFSAHPTRALSTGHAKIRNKNGRTTYLLRDVAATLDRNAKYAFDKLMYVVSQRQDAHFQQLRAVLELTGHPDLADRLQHFGFGMARGLTPQPDTRGLLLSDILDQCRTTVKDLLEREPETYPEFRGSDDAALVDLLGATALMTQDLSIRRKEELIFDIPNIGATEDYTGLDLQSWVLKLSSKLRGVTLDREDLAVADYSIFEGETGEPYAEVLRFLIQFPHQVKFSLDRLESSSVLAYLFRLTDLIGNIWPEDDEAEGSSSKQNLAQLALYEAVRQVLENGMRLVGLTPAKTVGTVEDSGVVPIEVVEEVAGDRTDETTPEAMESDVAQNTEPTDSTAEASVPALIEEPAEASVAHPEEALVPTQIDTPEETSVEASEEHPGEIVDDTAENPSPEVIEPAQDKIHESNDEVPEAVASEPVEANGLQPTEDVVEATSELSDAVSGEPIANEVIGPAEGLPEAITSEVVHDDSLQAAEEVITSPTPDLAVDVADDIAAAVVQDPNPEVESSIEAQEPKVSIPEPADVVQSDPAPESAPTDFSTDGSSADTTVNVPEDPEHEALGTEALAPGAPASEAPTIEAPTIEAPTTEASTTEAATVEESTTEAPGTEAPQSTENTSHEPHISEQHMPGHVTTIEAH